MAYQNLISNFFIKNVINDECIEFLRCLILLSNIKKAGELAEQIALKVQNTNGDLSPIYYKLEEILVNYRREGMDMDLIMPAMYEVDLEYNRTNPDGRSVWIAYAEVLHEDLCNPNSILHQKIKSKNFTGASIIEYILDKLKLSDNSAMLISPIAGSILGLGVTAFCKHEHHTCF